MNILIIGAGGVTSYLLPVLLKAFDVTELTLMDGDTLEERNLDRQQFCPSMIGANKAGALIRSYKDNTLNNKIRFTIHAEFLTESTTLPDNLDVIICAADNHEARRNAMRAGETLDIPVYVAGNEYFDSQAFVRNYMNRDTPRDPFVKYPEILTSDVGSPTSCQGAEQVAFPQLAIANFAAASKILHLMYVWEVYAQKEGVQLLAENPELLPVEIYGTMFATSHI